MSPTDKPYTTPAERKLLLAELELLWEKYPTMRFGQLLENFVFGYMGRESKLFWVSDEKVLRILRGLE